LLASLLWLKLRQSYILASVIGAIVLVVAHRAFLWHGEVSFSRAYAGLDTRADSILIGCLVGLLTAWRLLPTLKRGLAAGLTLLVGLFITAMLLFSSHHAGYMYRGGLTCFAAAVGILLCLILTTPPRLLLRCLEFRPLAWIGTLSYGLYLWHIPVHSFLYDPNRPLLLRLTLAFGVTFAVATVSYYLVEQPCLKLKKRFHKTSQAVQPVLQAERVWAA
jgi:peptidoglycan/LPS O-acetylase OafA/YrhL